MTQPVIDTLRLADRLKESGFQDTQAEGLARALGGEFVDHIVTKADLDSGIKLVRADYRVLNEKIGALDERIDALDDKLETRLGALDEKFEGRFGALDERIGALDDKLETRLGALDGKVETRIDSLGRQITFVFAALAALLALGLIDTVQRLLG